MNRGLICAGTHGTQGYTWDFRCVPFFQGLCGRFKANKPQIADLKKGRYTWYSTSYNFLYGTSRNRKYWDLLYHVYHVYQNITIPSIYRLFKKGAGM